MSWLSKATGIHLGNIGAPVGALLGSVIPGVGTAIGAGLGQGIGALGSGKGIGTAVGQGVAAGVGAKALPIAGKAVGSILGGSEGAGDDTSSDGGGIDWLGKLKEFGGDVAGLVKAYGPIALTGLNIYNAGQSQGQADDYAKSALQGTEDRFAAKAPLRSAGIAGLLDPGAGTPDLSNIRNLATSGSGNPFAKALPVAQAATPVKASPLPIAQSPATIAPGAALPPGAAAFAAGGPNAPVPKKILPVASQ